MDVVSDPIPQGLPGAFCLLAEPLGEEAPPDPAALPRLVVPSGGVAALEGTSASGWSLGAGADASAIRLEAVPMDGRPALLLSVAAGAGAGGRVAPPRVRRNGAPAGLLDVLAVGDQLQVDTTIFHVSFVREPRVGAPPEAAVGKPCPVCALPIERDSVVVVHDCGTALHLEPQTEDDPEPLECALLACPTCDAPVELEAGLAFLPEL